VRVRDRRVLEFQLLDPQECERAGDDDRQQQRCRGTVVSHGARGF
jgi:hypothetical protein